MKKTSEVEVVSMLLAIDIGNTNIHNGIFKGKKLKETFRIPTHSENIYSRLYIFL